MDALSWFCANCGASNSKDRQRCFACTEPRLEEDAASTAPHLLQDRYRLLAPVGSGGFGVVYRAIDTQDNNRLVAVKQIRMHGLSTTEIIEATDAFHREFQLLSNLRHPGLPRIHERFTDPNNWYIVMDFVQGETLERYLEHHAPAAPGTGPLLPLDEVLDIGLQLCDILSYLHTRLPPVIFRDLKPSNIVRVNRERLFLIDFGTARRYRPGMLKDTIPLGSPGYAAPEQYGRAQTTPRSDIYSLGALLHYLLSGHDPADSPFHFASLHPATPGDAKLSALIERMVEREIAKRPSHMGEVENELRTLHDERAGNQGISPRVYITQVPPRTHPSRSSSSWSGWSSSTRSATRLQQQQQMPYQAQMVKKPGRRTALIILGLLAMGAAGNALSSFSGSAHHNSYSKPWPEDDTAADTPPVPAKEVAHLSWAADGSRLALRYIDGSVRVAEIHDRQLATSPIGPIIFSLNNAQAIQIALSSDGRQLAIAVKSGMQIWDLETGRILQFFNTSSSITNIAWLGNGYFRLAAIGEDNVIRIWSMTSTASFTLSQTDMVITGTTLAWSPDGTYLLTDATTTQNSAYGIALWDIAKQQLARFYTTSATFPIAAAWSPDSSYFALSDTETRTGIYRPTEDTPAFTLTSDASVSFTRTRRILSWSPDGQYIVAVFGQILQIWKGTLFHYDLVSTSIVGSAQSLLELAWSPTGKRLLIAQTDQEIEEKNLP